MPIIDRRGATATRRSLILALAVGVSSCMGSDNAVLRHARFLTATIRKPPALKREDVAKFAAASISVRVGGAAEALVLLNRIEGKNQFWFSSDRIMLVTRGGRVTQTAGFQSDLVHTEMTTPDPVDGALLTADHGASQRLLDYEDFGVGIQARSKYRIVGRDPIQIIGSTIPTVRVVEQVRVPALKWWFTNTYWVHEQTGAVWKSRQHFHPERPVLTITTMRQVKT